MNTKKIVRGAYECYALLCFFVYCGYKTPASACYEGLQQSPALARELEEVRSGRYEQHVSRVYPWYQDESDFGQQAYKEVEQWGLRLWLFLHQAQQRPAFEEAPVFYQELVDTLLAFYRECSLLCEHGYAYVWPVYPRLLGLLAHIQKMLHVWRQSSVASRATYNRSDCHNAIVARLVVQVIMVRLSALITRSMTDAPPIHHPIQE